ncbi:LLM class flavin-dependent oxidoreductase [Streptomyces sp. NPDC054804]
MLTLAAIARGTARIDMVATGSATFNEPYNLAHQFKTLDVVSHGRAGWNAVTTSDPRAAANHGGEIAPRDEWHERAHEVIQVVQALWGSWGRDALVTDVEASRFADASRVQPINLRGRHVASRGPLPVPPSEQGHAVIFQAGGSSHGLGLAGMYASGIIGATWTIEDARAQQATIREAAERSSRNPDEVKFFAACCQPPLPRNARRWTSASRSAGRRFLTRTPRFDAGHTARRGATQQAAAPEPVGRCRASTSDPSAGHALGVAREGWTLRDVLAHGVIDYHPVITGPPSEGADHMQEWFEALAVDGFWVVMDAYNPGVDTFVDEVVPILQERGLFHPDYETSTLRGHLGVPDQYGLDPRLASNSCPRAVSLIINLAAVSGGRAS